MRRDPREDRGRIELPVHRALRAVIVGAHYPENVGAAARALKTMGFRELWLVAPGRLARPDHEMARKMAVKSLDVLEGARVVERLDEALGDVALVLATTARRGVSGVLSARDAGRRVVLAAERGERAALVFGNEKTGLGEAELLLAHERVRLPMAADQPSINLAQAVQLCAYECFVAALEARPERSVV
jgi:TrmH family RNA methyltransferase